MPTPTKGPRLGGSPAHERLLLANLATALFEHDGITTTVTKAKRLRPLAERLITSAKRGDLHARRQVLTVVRDKSVVHRLFTEIGPRFENRPGGYTRITKLGPRKGDNAPMARIELVEALTVAQQAVGEAERARGSRFSPRRATGTGAATTVTLPTAEDEAVPASNGGLPVGEGEAVDPAEPRHTAVPVPDEAGSETDLGSGAPVTDEGVVTPAPAVVSSEAEEAAALPATDVPTPPAGGPAAGPHDA